MRILRLVVLVAAAAVIPNFASADSYWDVEAARANARAGGPTNARDAELLERYGCLSGTRSRFCRSLSGEGGKKYYRPSRRSKR